MAMQIETVNFGTVEIGPEDVVEFARGLFGFEDVRRYVLLRHTQGSPFRLLQAVDRPDLAFAVIEPYLIHPDYSVELTDEEAQSVGWWEDRNVLVFVIVGITSDPDEMTANMKGPILIDPASRRGLQVVLPGDRWPARMRLMETLRLRDEEAAIAAGIDPATAKP